MQSNPYSIFLLIARVFTFFNIWTFCDASSNATDLYNITYSEFNFPGAAYFPPGTNSTYPTGVRHLTGADLDTVLISGFSLGNEAVVTFLYKGSISDHSSGQWFVFSMPSTAEYTVTQTYFYGPNSLGKSTNGIDMVQAVGSFSCEEYGIREIAVVYEGNIEGDGSWTVLWPPFANRSEFFEAAAHSTMGGMVVANYYSSFLEKDRAYVYSLSNGWYEELTHPAATGVSAYGIWHNNESSTMDEYYITGGVKDGLIFGGFSFVCKFNSTNRTTYNWVFFDGDTTSSSWSHFEGISPASLVNDTTTTANAANSNYTFAANWHHSNTQTIWNTSLVVVPDIDSSSSKSALWIDFAFPNSVNNSCNSVYQNMAIGKFNYADEAQVTRGFIATFVKQQTDADTHDDEVIDSRNGNDDDDDLMGLTMEQFVGISSGIAALLFLGGVLSCYYFCYRNRTQSSFIGDARPSPVSFRQSLVDCQRSDSGAAVKSDTFADL